MASVFKPTYTKKDKSGRKVTQKLKKWYVKYRDAEGIVQKVPGYTDKAATQQLAAKLEREAELGKVGILNPFEKHRRKPLTEHLKDFEMHLRDSDDSDHHVHQTTERTRNIVEWCQFIFIDDLSPSSVEAFLGDLRNRGRSIQTSNHYLTAIKQFCRWLVEDRRTGESPIAHLKRLNTETDRRHDRRPLSSDEFAKLIESAIAGPPIEAVTGEERAMLYILAAWTGYRRKELASITLRSFDLQTDNPTLRVKAGSSKHRKDDVVPLHPVVVERLHEWLATKGEIDPNKPLFALLTPGGQFRRTSKMMRRDLERCGIPYQDEDGLFADFHSNRHTFISNLAKADVSPKMAQSLARHSDVNLTMNVYTHVDSNDQSKAVSRLPAPPEVRHVPKHVPTAASPRRQVASVGSEPATIRRVASKPAFPVVMSHFVTRWKWMSQEIEGLDNKRGRCLRNRGLGVRIPPGVLRLTTIREGLTLSEHPIGSSECGSMLSVRRNSPSRKSADPEGAWIRPGGRTESSAFQTFRKWVTQRES